MFVNNKGELSNVKLEGYVKLEDNFNIKSLPILKVLLKDIDDGKLTKKKLTTLEKELNALFKK